MQNETAHGQEGSQSCNLCEGPVCPSRIRLVCLEIHLDQSLGTRIIASDGHTGSDTDSNKDRTHLQSVICKDETSIHHTKLNIWKYNCSTKSSMKTCKRFSSLMCTIKISTQKLLL